MGGITFQKEEAYTNHENTLDEIWYEPTEVELKSLINTIQGSSALLSADRCLYAYGYGKGTRSSYARFSKRNGVELILQGFIGPSIIGPLRYFIAGQAGLLKLSNPELIGPCIEQFSHLAMVGLFSMAKAFEPSFVGYMHNNKGSFRSTPEKHVKNDASYFHLIVDGDNVEAETGVLAIVSIGKEAPKDLHRVFYLAKGI